MRKEFSQRSLTTKSGVRRGAMRVFHIRHIERRVVVYEVEAETAAQALEKALDDDGELVEQFEIGDEGPFVEEVKRAQIPQS
jgi:hypothetical protein